MRYLLDTNIVSQYAKETPDAKVHAWIQAHNDADLFLSCITLAELHFGIESMPAGKKRSLLQRWVDEDLSEAFAGRVLYLTEETTRHFGKLMARAKKAGHTPASMDVLIAALAMEHGMVLVTLDQDFRKLDIEMAEL